MGSLSPWHWAIVLLVLVLLFGSKRLPDAARGLGRSLRIFKSEVSELRQDTPAPQPPAEPAELPPSQTPPAAPTMTPPRESPRTDQQSA